MNHEILSVTVDGIWRQGEHNLAIRLVAGKGEVLPGWQPGAHIDLHLPNGIIRQYSLTGTHAQTESYLICVARERNSRGGSQYIHERLRPGQRLSVSPPRNLFALHSAPQVMLLAAGIGITPLYAMALQLTAEARPFTLHYWVKHRENAAFISEMAQQLPAGSLMLHCSSEGQSPRRHLPTILSHANTDQPVYLCGPAGFMAAGRQLAQEKGWHDTRIHSEAFQPLPATTGASDDGTFTVILSSSGARWPVPGDKTIAQVLQENGVAVPLSCEMGICGACLTPVVEGEVDHRDTVQSASEKCGVTQHIALCCSRSHSADLVIDL